MAVDYSKFPTEYFVYEEDAHDIPANAFSVEDEGTVRYVRGDLAMNEDMVRKIAKIMCSADGYCTYCAKDLITQFSAILDESLAAAAQDVFNKEFDVGELL